MCTCNICIFYFQQVQNPFQAALSNPQYFDSFHPFLPPKRKMHSENQEYTDNRLRSWICFSSKDTRTTPMSRVFTYWAKQCLFYMINVPGKSLKKLKSFKLTYDTLNQPFRRFGFFFRKFWLSICWKMHKVVCKDHLITIHLIPTQNFQKN